MYLIISFFLLLAHLISKTIPTLELDLIQHLALSEALAEGTDVADQLLASIVDGPVTLIYDYDHMNVAKLSLDRLKWLLDHGFRPGQINCFGNHTLHRICAEQDSFEGAIDMCARYMSEDDLNAVSEFYGWNALTIAVYGGSYDKALNLLRLGAKAYLNQPRFGDEVCPDHMRELIRRTSELQHQIEIEFMVMQKLVDENHDLKDTIGSLFSRKGYTELYLQRLEDIFIEVSLEFSELS